MIDNNICVECQKESVCKNRDILDKFSDSAKKQLGIDITIDACENFSIERMPDGVVTECE